MTARAIIAAALLALAACAPAREATPTAAAPADPAPNAVKVADAGPGVIRVTGPIIDQDALAPLHCAAAKRARSMGAVTMEWTGGVAKPRVEGYAADMVYETAMTGATIGFGGDAKPAEGGPVPVENWLIYCDEAGISREGEA